MRNNYPGVCYRCGKMVAEREGHFERYNGGWRTQHASCAIDARKAKDIGSEGDKS
jgi:predicted metal-binding protein